MATTVERFWGHVDKTDTCWHWTSAKHRGYGQFTLRGFKNEEGKWRCQTVRAHRFAYELLVGPLEPDITIDHECENPGCVRPGPGHCVPRTRGENALRGTGPAALNRRKTHCLSGHPLAGDNLTPRSNGKRECKTCARDRARAYRAAKKESVK